MTVPADGDRFAFACACGRALHSKRSLVGSAFRCPSCKFLMRVPPPHVSDPRRGRITELPVAEPAPLKLAATPEEGPSKAEADAESAQRVESIGDLDDLDDVAGKPLI